jgi:predicted nucleotide-binding protein
MTDAEQVERRPEKKFERALYDFMCMSKGASQSLMIRYFVEQIITHSDVCEQGSVLVHSSPPEIPLRASGTLKLFEKATNVNSIAKFPGANFSVDEGLAGLVFRKRQPEFAPIAKKHPEFIDVEGQNIGEIYCIPILLEDDDAPFGVVSFHNPVPSEKLLDADKRDLMNVAVKSLEAMLSTAPIKLVPDERLFIVHGRDERFLQELIEILRLEKIEPVVIQTFARTGQDLLTFIENRIRSCVAGFVLLTPDDEGRLYQFGEPLRQRARQNVIFEGGYLTALFRGTNRICFVQQGDLEIPSDLNGLLMERFDQKIDPARISVALRDWGLKGGNEQAPSEHP